MWYGEDWPTETQGHALTKYISNVTQKHRRAHQGVKDVFRGKMHIDRGRVWTAEQTDSYAYMSSTRPVPHYSPYHDHANMHAPSREKGFSFGKRTGREPASIAPPSPGPSDYNITRMFDRNTTLPCSHNSEYDFKPSNLSAVTMTVPLRTQRNPFRLYDDAMDRHARQEERRQQYLRNEVEECTFSPNINFTASSPQRRAPRINSRQGALRVARQLMRQDSSSEDDEEPAHSSPTHIRRHTLESVAQDDNNGAPVEIVDIVASCDAENWSPRSAEAHEGARRELGPGDLEGEASIRRVDSEQSWRHSEQQGASGSAPRDARQRTSPRTPRSASSRSWRTTQLTPQLENAHDYTERRRVAALPSSEEYRPLVCIHGKLTAGVCQRCTRSASVRSSELSGAHDGEQKLKRFLGQETAT